MQKEVLESYVSSVLRLQRFYNKHLEDISEEELRQYWLCCQSEFGWRPATLRISYAGIQHFFSKTLVRSWNIFNQIKWKREQTLPTILSLQEVRKIIYALPTLQSHTFYLTLYSLGLRLREATTLQVSDILSDRGLVHIHAGKGALDRMVPLPKITLSTLRKYYKTHRNSQWYFSCIGSQWRQRRTMCKRPCQRQWRSRSFATHIETSGVEKTYSSPCLSPCLCNPPAGS